MTVPVRVDEVVQAEVPRMREEPRFVDTLELVALPTAVSVARMFISDTLKRWHALFIEDYLAALAVELVTLSVAATSPAEDKSWTDITELNPIKLRMLGYQRHIVFEVTDMHDEPLTLPADVELPEGSGLGLVHLPANRWGPSVGPRGRVNWAELAVYERTPAGLPLRDPRPPTYPNSSTGTPAPTVDPHFSGEFETGCGTCNSSPVHGHPLVTPHHGREDASSPPTCCQSYETPWRRR